ncbi:unnamed protein product, partial [Lymnaea stagnalis]
MITGRPYALLAIWSVLVLPTYQTARQKRQILADQPRLITENGHLIFQSGTNHNITFRGGESSGIFINTIDMKVALRQVDFNKANIGTLQTNVSYMSSNLTARLTSLETVINGPFSYVRDRIQVLDNNITQQVNAHNGLDRRVADVERNIGTHIRTSIEGISGRLRTLERR